MNNGPSYFEIQGDDLERARRFYSMTFGWEFTRAEGMPIEYWRIRTGTSAGGLLGRPCPIPSVPSGTNAYVCSIEVADFDTATRKILDLGGIVAMEKFAVPGKCWQGYFQDTEGNTFGIFQPDEEAK